MALDPKLSLAGRNRSLDAVFDILNGGFIDIYNGSKPADPDVAVSGQTKLARLALNATAFAAATGGTKTANAIASAAALATGTATWCRILRSNGTTAERDLSVGTATANLVLNSVDIQNNATVSVTSYVESQAA